MKEIIYYIDKSENVESLYKYDRTYKNHIADGLGEVVGMFVAALTNELDRMPNNSSISITIRKNGY